MCRPLVLLSHPFFFTFLLHYTSHFSLACTGRISIPIFSAQHTSGRFRPFPPSTRPPLYLSLHPHHPQHRLLRFASPHSFYVAHDALSDALYLGLKLEK